MCAAEGMKRATGKSIVGLDIQPGYVAAVEGRPGQVSVERAAVAPLPPGAVRDGELVDVDTVAEVLRGLFAQHKLARRVRIGVANQRIVMRTIDLPPLTEAKEIASAVRFQASEHIPMPLDQAVLEHQVLGPVQSADGPRTRVVVVAARRDMIDRLLELTRKAGLRAHGIDLSAFAMIRALHRPQRTEPTAYVSLGGVTNLAVAEGPTCLFTRVAPHGTEAIAEELAERRGLTLDHARGWLRHVGLAKPVDEVEGEAEIVLEARSVLSDGARRIVDDLRNSLDFYGMQDGAAPVSAAVLTGPALAIPGFANALGDGLGLPVELGLVGESRSGGLSGAEPGELTVAAGLTVEEVRA
jgi:type IV pilus assembly protein PilM